MSLFCLIYYFDGIVLSLSLDVGPTEIKRKKDTAT
jgi:hypothetical protein